MIKLIREVYRYFRYYRKDEYLSDSWLDDLNAGRKDNIIIR